MAGKKEKVHLSTYDTNVIQLGITNNKMATPAPVQLQLPLTVSGLVFLCIRLWCEPTRTFSFTTVIFPTFNLLQSEALKWVIEMVLL